MRPVTDNIARRITRRCYHGSSRGEFAQNTNGPCQLERPFSPAAPAALVILRSAVISWWRLFRQMQTGVDGLTSRTIIEHSSVKAELKVCCSLSPLPPSLIFVCFHSSSPVFILCCAFYDSHCLCFLHNAPFTLLLSVLVFSFLHHHHHHPHHCYHLPPLIWLNSSPLLPFRLSCRAPVTPSGVTRTVSDSRRTCYLVTRL